MTEPNGNYLSTWVASKGRQESNRAKWDWFECNYAQILPHNTSAKILEMGPGYGEFIDYLINEKGFTEVNAIDNSLDVVEYCNLSFPGCVELVPDMNTYFGERHECFQLVVMFHVLEHLPRSQVIQYLSRIRESLAIGGSLIIEVPNMANPFIASYKRYADFTHEGGFTVESLHQVLLAAEFKNIQVLGGSIPMSSPKRVMQRCLQKMCNAIIKSMMLPYVPNANVNLSSAVIGIATV